MLGENLTESLKEGLRVFLMSVIPLVIVDLETSGTVANPRAIMIAGLIAILRFSDKLLHKQGFKTKLEFDALNKLK